MLGSTRSICELAQEAAILAERSDISEELDRLRSHCSSRKIAGCAGELARKLDFCCKKCIAEAEHDAFETPGVESEALTIRESDLRSKRRLKNCLEQVQKHRMSADAKESDGLIVSGPSGSGNHPVQRIFRWRGRGIEVCTTSRAARLRPVGML